MKADVRISMLTGCLLWPIFIALAGCQGGGAGSDTTPCQPNPCSDPNRTVCNAQDAQAVCSCDLGYHDEEGACARNESCTAESCNGHGRCVDVTGALKCGCEAGYTGERCELCDEAQGYEPSKDGKGCHRNPCSPTPCDESADPGCSERNRVACACGEDFVGSYTDSQCHPLNKLDTTKAESAIEEYGTQVAIDGDVAVVSAPAGLNAQGQSSGAIYIYERSSSGIWTQTARMTPSDGGAVDRYGMAIAVKGELILVGAPLHQGRRNQRTGAAYLIRKTEAGWQEEMTLRAFDGLKDEQFGSAVAISDVAFVVGAPLDDTPAGKDAGSVYVFERDGLAIRTYAKLGSPSGRAYDNFGGSLATSGLSILVGAPGEDQGADNAGAAYLYTRSAQGPWQPIRLASNAPSSNGAFGLVVAMHEDTALVGASGETVGTLGRAGAAYLFEKAAGDWSQVTRIVAQGAKAKAGFGASVAVGNGLALVGAYLDQGPDKEVVGSGVYLSRKVADHWQAPEKIYSPKTQKIGKAIALSGQTAIVGVSDTVSLTEALIFLGEIQ